MKSIRVDEIKIFIDSSMRRLDSNVKTTWHVNPNEDTDELTAKQGHNLMAVAAKRVWEELYVAKKPAIEEVNTFPTSLLT